MSRSATYNREQFIILWLKAYKEGLSQNWIAEQLGVTHQAVNSRGLYLRNIGIELPLLNAKIAQNEKERLNKLISEELGEQLSES